MQRPVVVPRSLLPSVTTRRTLMGLIGSDTRLLVVTWSSSRRSVRSLACRDRSCCFRWCGRQLSLRNMPISGVDPTPRPTAVYASNDALPRRPQDSLPSCLLGFGRTRLVLASSHQLLLSHPASGSSGESFAPGDVAMDDPGFVDHPSTDAVRDSPVEEAPQMAMLSATPGLALARWAIRCRFVDRFAGLRVPSRVSRQRFSAPGASLPSGGSR